MKTLAEDKTYFECDYDCDNCDNQVCEEIDEKAVDDRLIEDGIYDEDSGLIIDSKGEDDDYSVDEFAEDLFVALRTIKKQ